ncbi:MAG TPA: hypothetical protein VGH87_21865 [Polyangiaceae bacterium]|jgi:hypothetical protein
MKNALYVVVAVLSISTIVLAQQRPHPFHEARLAACRGKSAGDACSFQGPEGKTVSASCQQNHRSELVCGAFHRH